MVAWGLITWLGDWETIIEYKFSLHLEYGFRSSRRHLKITRPNPQFDFNFFYWKRTIEILKCFKLQIFQECF